LLSASIYYAARNENVPVVQSLRNYRLLCPNAYFLRDGKPCEQCLGKSFAWPAIQHACYRDSRAASAVVATMSAMHRSLGKSQKLIAIYFTPSRFARTKFIEAGLDGDRIFVKPNFVDPDPGPGEGNGEYAAFVGRLSPEKGIATLLEAWSDPRIEMPLKIIGTGPMAADVIEAARLNPRIDYVGHQSLAEALELVGRARCLVMPSVWYETFGRTIVEAFAKGTPVVASNMGCMAELVVDGDTGLLFEPGSAAGLADAIFRLTRDPERLSSMRHACRREYLENYGAERNYQLLMELYQRAGADHAADVTPLVRSH
jgi:glycosyltransferase involved in cell wall biosynthesis